METNKSINMGYVTAVSVIAALGGLLFGYDTAVISGTVSQVSHQFGLNTMQSGWYVGCALIGSIIGVIFSGKLSDTIGRKHTMIISAVLFIASAVGCALSGSLNELVIWRMVGGAGIGIVSVVCPLYISEVSPAAHRGRLVATYQLAVTIGFLAAYLMNFYLLNQSHGYSSANPTMQRIFGTEVWRGMLGFGALPAILYFLVSFFLSESPRWLLVKSRDKAAQQVFSKIYRNQKDVSFQINETKQMLQAQAGENHVSARFSKGGIYRMRHCHVGAVYGRKCRVVLRPVDFRNQRVVQRGFAFLSVAHRYGEHGDHYSGHADYR